MVANAPSGNNPCDADAGEFFADSTESVQVAGAEVPWVCVSGAHGLRSCSLPLISAGQPAATYRVKLIFTPPESGPAEFDIKIQDVTRRVAIGGGRAQVVEFVGVLVDDQLQLAFASATGGELPTLCGIEVNRAE